MSRVLHRAELLISISVLRYSPAAGRKPEPGGGFGTSIRIQRSEFRFDTQFPTIEGCHVKRLDPSA